MAKIIKLYEQFDSFEEFQQVFVGIVFERVLKENTFI